MGPDLAGIGRCPIGRCASLRVIPSRNTSVSWSTAVPSCHPRLWPTCTDTRSATLPQRNGLIPPCTVAAGADTPSHIEGCSLLVPPVAAEIAAPPSGAHPAETAAGLLPVPAPLARRPGPGRRPHRDRRRSGHHRGIRSAGRDRRLPPDPRLAGQLAPQSPPGRHRWRLPARATIRHRPGGHPDSGR
jgi:hypothetical protein